MVTTNHDGVDDRRQIRHTYLPCHDQYDDLAALAATAVFCPESKKDEFVTGAVRDSQSDKVPYDLVPLWLEERLAVHLGHGSRKYAAWNWCKGMPVKRTLASIRRHLKQLVEGDRSEDHMAAVVFGAMVLEHTLVNIKAGVFPAELLDLEHDKLPELDDFRTDFKEAGIQ